MVGQLVRGDGKQIAFQRPRSVVIRQAREQPDQRFLHDVLGGIAAPQSGLDISQQPALEPRDQFLPGFRLPGPNAVDEDGVGGHGGRLQDEATGYMSDGSIAWLASILAASRLRRERGNRFQPHAR